MLKDPKQIKETRAYTLLVCVYVTLVVVLIATAGRLSFFNVPFMGQVYYGAPYYIVPGIFFIENVLAEVYGYERSRRAVQLSILCSFIYGAYLLFTVLLPSPPQFSKITQEFNDVFRTFPRHYLAFVAAWYSGSILNEVLLVKFKIMMQGRHFILRALTSVFFGELLYQIIGSLVSRLGTLSLLEIAKYDTFSFVSKLGFEILLAPFILVLCRYLKRLEQLDVYDYSTKFNPLKLTIDHA